MATRPHPDFEVVGADGDVKLVAGVKGSAKGIERAREQVLQYAAGLNAPWAMVATPDEIQLFRITLGNRIEPVDAMPMSRLVAHYGRQNNRELYFESYVRTMLELWLRDLTVHWHQGKEPAPSLGPPEFRAAVNAGRLLVEP